MMITKLFYFDLTGKKICPKFLRSKNFKKQVSYRVVKVEAEGWKGKPLKNSRFISIYYCKSLLTSNEVYITKLISNHELFF